MVFNSTVVCAEISLVQSGAAPAAPASDTRMVDVYREKPIRLVVKVAVPVKEHPKVSYHQRQE